MSTRIPIHLFKSLYRPEEPVEAHSLHIVQADPDSVLDFFIANVNGDLVDMFAPRSVSPILLASVVVDFDAGTDKQDLVLVPAARRVIVTGWDIDDLSAVPTTAAFKAGWNDDADDVLTDEFNLSDLIDDVAKSAPLLSQQARVVGTAGQTLGITVTTAQAMTLRMNVFGYQTDLDRVPVPNVL